jgi:dTDP-glucose 4,6-dehydratase
MGRLMPTYIVTGAAGFIGSALCRSLRGENHARVIGVDKMTYAASRAALAALDQDPQFELIEADICDASRMMEIVVEAQPDAILHLAAETHVDRSIDRPDPFLQTNIVGTYALLEIMRFYLATLSTAKREQFRFLHVSTDEVYGELGETGSFSESSAYAPNSPYAASKAAADHLVRAWHKTYGVPVIISNCSNNYGPFQFPEKLIPLMIAKALQGEKLPVYGQGLNVRDWLYVEDHADALSLILTKGRVGEKYHVGGNAEWRNIDLVQKLCDILDEALPQSPHWPHRDLITFVADRPGHDARYAMDFRKLKNELGWAPRTPLEEGLRRTVAWHLANHAWFDDIRTHLYGGERLGQIAKSA